MRHYQFYYHHAPCHFAQTADYLFTQIEVATSDNITFPYVRQQGMYGLRTGYLENLAEKFF
ncbi:MAG: hypothetical protein ACLUKN_14510 [Bacilli bacterium]